MNMFVVRTVVIHLYYYNKIGMSDQNSKFYSHIYCLSITPPIGASNRERYVRMRSSLNFLAYVTTLGFYSPQTLQKYNEAGYCDLGSK
jgi:hypothetical protein